MSGMCNCHQRLMASMGAPAVQAAKTELAGRGVDRQLGELRTA